MNFQNFAGDKAAARDAWRAWSKAPRSATSHRPIKARKAADGATELLVYDEIGLFGLTAKAFRAELDAVTSGNVRVRINSPGGDVFDGLAIYNALKSFPGNVSTVVDGLAASAASVVAMAGDTVAMSEAALMMVHRAWALAIGNRNDMADMVTTLDKVDGQLAGIYARRTGQPTAAMLALMDGKSDGTWFTAQEAIDAGLTDEIAATDAPDAQAIAEFTIRDAERALRDAGAPRALAKSIIEKGFKGAKRRDDEPSTADRIKVLTASLSSAFNNGH